MILTINFEHPFEVYSHKIFHDVVAVQLTRANAQEIAEWCGGSPYLVPHVSRHPAKSEVYVMVPNGKHSPTKANMGDYVVTPDGKNFTVKDANIFESRYEKRNNV